MYDVVLLAPFHWTTEEATKLVPVMINVNAGPPAVTEDGETEVIDGIMGEDGGVTKPEPPPHPITQASVATLKAVSDERLAKSEAS
jgi:hypothetical protein